jgi:hypothetical protein
MIGMASPSQCIGIAGRNQTFLGIIRNHRKTLDVAFKRHLLEPVKGPLSYDPELITHVLYNNRDRFLQFKKSTFVQAGDKVELDEFISYYGDFA